MAQALGRSQSELPPRHHKTGRPQSAFRGTTVLERSLSKNPRTRPVAPYVELWTKGF